MTRGYLPKFALRAVQWYGRTAPTFAPTFSSGAAHHRRRGKNGFFARARSNFLSFESIFPLTDFAARARTRLWKA